jgi:hypothetical protein
LAKKMRVGSALAGISIDTLNAEIRRRQRGMKGLISRYNKAAAKAGRLAAQIESLGGSVSAAAGGTSRRGPARGRPRGSTGRKRPKNKMSLMEALAGVLKGKELGVTEAAAAVLSSGYRTSAANFRTMVNQALLKSNKFKKISRGVYTAK